MYSVPIQRVTRTLRQQNGVTLTQCAVSCTGAQTWHHAQCRNEPHSPTAWSKSASEEVILAGSQAEDLCYHSPLPWTLAVCYRAGKISQKQVANAVLFWSRWHSVKLLAWPALPRYQKSTVLSWSAQYKWSNTQLTQLRFQCLFRYMFRPARAVLMLKNCVKAHTKVDIYKCVCVFFFRNEDWDLSLQWIE